MQSQQIEKAEKTYVSLVKQMQMKQKTNNNS